MIIDGKKIAKEILEDVRKEIEALPRPLTLGIVSIEPDFATGKFLSIKRDVARVLGVSLIEERIPSVAQTQDVLGVVKELILQTDGVVIQLPLPPSLNTEALLRLLPSSHDVDGLGGSPFIRPPVIEAMREILKRHELVLKGKRVVVVGEGRLVGIPAAKWLREEGAHVAVVRKDDTDHEKEFKNADIIVLGAGDPGLLQPHMIKEGVVILDAGTSEAGGKLAGDADPECAKHASLFTPVPGGIGPVAVVMIFKNLLTLARLRLAP